MRKPDHWMGITEEEWLECVALEYCLSQGFDKPGDYERYVQLQNKKIYKPKTAA